VNFAGSILLICYLTFFTIFSTVTTFMTLSVYVNVEKFRSARKMNRTLFFTLYLVLNLSNIPFGLFMSMVFGKLGDYLEKTTDQLYVDYPLFDLASLAVLTGMASHILFVAFWIVAWMHVEARVERKE
jgi:hypothetical protein